MYLSKLISVLSGPFLWQDVINQSCASCTHPTRQLRFLFYILVSAERGSTWRVPKPQAEPGVYSEFTPDCRDQHPWRKWQLWRVYSTTSCPCWVPISQTSTFSNTISNIQESPESLLATLIACEFTPPWGIQVPVFDSQLLWRLDLTLSPVDGESRAINITALRCKHCIDTYACFKIYISLKLALSGLKVAYNIIHLGSHLQIIWKLTWHIQNSQNTEPK